MLTLANNTHIVFVSNEEESMPYPYAGWNIMGNLVSVLARRFGEYPHGHPKRTMEALKKLRETGYLTPEECGDDGHGTNSYWIVEKAIPMVMRAEMREQQLKASDIIGSLRV